jgi:hypothetical protein
VPQKRSAAKAIRERAALYEASGYTRTYHCRNIVTILNQLRNGIGNWLNDVERPALYRFIYGSVKEGVYDIPITTDKLAQEVLEEVLEEAPDDDKSDYERYVTVKRIVLLGKGLRRTLRVPPCSQLGYFVFKGCKKLSYLPKPKDVNTSVVHESCWEIKKERSHLLAQLEREVYSRKGKAAVIAAIEGLRKVQAEMKERDRRIRERIANIINDPISSSLGETEKTYFKSVAEYAFDEETNIKRDPVDGGIADVIEKLKELKGLKELEELVADGYS